MGVLLRNFLVESGNDGDVVDEAPNKDELGRLTLEDLPERFGVGYPRDMRSDLNAITVITIDVCHPVSEDGAKIMVAHGAT
jgi:hypothetical protein